jgi:uncharacterized OsmC-like protein
MTKQRVTAMTISLALAASTAFADATDDKIARAMLAAPSDISAQATIMDVDGTVLREGTNGWVCMPGVGLIPGDEHPMCNDAVWMSWIGAVVSDTDFSTDVIGVSYMLQGDAMVNNDNPMATDPNDGGVWVQDGPHIMMLFPNMQMLADLPRDPFAGGPYVMWGETPLAHVMVPLEAKDSVNDVISYLSENPKDAVSTSAPITAVMEDGLRCRATGSNGETVVTDMPKAIGGGGSEPSPGWLSRAALATCDATRIALRAAELGLSLDTLEVTADSVDDDRGLFGMDATVRAGSLSLRTRVKIGAAGVEEQTLREIVSYAIAHSPVADVCRAETPSTVEITIA